MMTSLLLPKSYPQFWIKSCNRKYPPLLLPTTTQRLVKLHIVLQFRVPRLGQAQRRKEVLLFVVLHFEKTGDATLETYGGQVGHLLVRFRLLLNFHSVQSRLVVAHESIGNIAERLLHGLLVGEFRFVALRPRQTVPAPDPASLEDRLDYLSTHGPECRRPLQEAGYGDALRAKCTGQ